MRLAPGTALAGVFTRNTFCAAPVVLARKHMKNDVRALVVNTGNANAGTGADGMKRALQVCEALAGHIAGNPEEVLPFSTGVIMEPLPAERIIAALPKALLAKSDWLAAAEVHHGHGHGAEGVSRKVRLSRGPVCVSGIAKGAGMIRPNMATMLSSSPPTRACRAQSSRDARAHRRTLIQLDQRRRRHIDKRLADPHRHRGRREVRRPRATRSSWKRGSPTWRAISRKPSCATARAPPSSSPCASSAAAAARNAAGSLMPSRIRRW